MKTTQATQILDPVIEYFGSIRLTYGFASVELNRHIARGIAPKLDQHAACEHGARGILICDRGGAACDFIVDDYICCAVGTGGTISGIINCSKSSQQVLGFPALKGDFLREDIRKFVTNSNWELITDYHFGGYAKVSEELILFINEFYKTYKIPLDPIYTGKMMFGILDLIAKNYFPKNSKVLVIHTGGLQGITGMNSILKQKQQLQITIHD